MVICLPSCSRIDWLVRRCERHGVEFRFGRAASAEDIARDAPDTIVLATGASLRAPAAAAGFAGTALDVCSFAARWPQDPPRAGVAVLFDHDHTAPTYAAACALAGTHARVILLTPRTAIAQSVNYCSGIGIHRRLFECGVEMRIASEPVGSEGKTIFVRNVFTDRESVIEDVETFVWATPRRVNDSLRGTLVGRDVRAIGDCVSPRILLIAIHEGRAAAMAL